MHSTSRAYNLKTTLHKCSLVVGLEPKQNVNPFFRNPGDCIRVKVRLKLITIGKFIYQKLAARRKRVQR